MKFKIPMHVSPAPEVWSSFVLSLSYEVFYESSTCERVLSCYFLFQGNTAGRVYMYLVNMQYTTILFSHREMY